MLFCWLQTVQSVNGQEVVSYKESVSMHASDAKGYTFKSAICALVLHRLPSSASTWSLIPFFCKTQIVRVFFSLMEIKYHGHHRKNRCWQWRKWPRTGRTNWPVQRPCTYALQQAGSSSHKISRLSLTLKQKVKLLKPAFEPRGPSCRSLSRFL